jgi:hypothetical protein
MQDTPRVLAAIVVAAWLMAPAGMSSGQEPTEAGTKTAGGLKITLLAAAGWPPCGAS